MSVTRKALSVLALVAAFAFADDDWGSDSSSYGDYSDDFANSTYNQDAEESSEEPTEVGSASASSDEWAGFDYKEMGLTQAEFQDAKAAGISREKLVELTEKGVRPTEYMQQPWKRMRMSEEEWLESRTNGMEDSDIDRSYRNKAGDQNYAYLSFLVPSLYQWHADQTIKAIWMDALWVAGVGGAITLAVTDDESTWMYMLIPVIAAHVWSGLDAFMATKNDNNPDANRFSFGILPTPDKGVASMFLMRF